MNAQERLQSGKVNGLNDHTVQIDGPIRSRNHGHGMVTVRSRSRIKNVRNTVFDLEDLNHILGS